MTSKLLIKTIGNTEVEPPVVLSGQHLLNLKGFQSFQCNTYDIYISFEQSQDDIVLASSTEGDPDKATSIISKALTASPGGVISLDLTSAGYQLYDITQPS